MRIKDMVKAINMKKHNFSEDVIHEFNMIAQDFDKINDKISEQRLVEKMDEILTEEQRLLLWEYGGSCRGGETGRQAKVLARELADKLLSEKVDLMNKNPHMYPTRYNDDGTITAYCGCHCLQYRIDKPETAKSPSAYGCAAGAALYNLKTALGVKAKIKSIDYPQQDDSKKSMTFTFEVVE